MKTLIIISMVLVLVSLVSAETAEDAIRKHWLDQGLSLELSTQISLGNQTAIEYTEKLLEKGALQEEINETIIKRNPREEFDIGAFFMISFFLGMIVVSVGYVLFKITQFF